MKKTNNLMKKKGVSPVIATVLLIGIVVVIIAIIFMWGRSVIKENVQKQGLPADQACSEINIRTSCYNGVITFTNLGNIPVYTINLRIISDGKTTVKQPTTDLGIGISESREIELDDYGISECPQKYEIIPVILGTAESAKKAYTCTDNVFVGT